MGIDIFELTNKRCCITTLSDSEFLPLESIMDEFQKRTGIYIDAYGTTRLYSAHIKLLVSLMVDYEANLAATEKEKFMVTSGKVKTVFSKAIADGADLMFEGD